MANAKPAKASPREPRKMSAGNAEPAAKTAVEDLAETSLRDATPEPLTGWSDQRAELFIASLAETLNVSAACRVSGLARSTVYRHYHDDPAFRDRWESMLEQLYRKLEIDVLARMLKGRRRTLRYAGKRVGQVLEYDDRGALALLKLRAEREKKLPRASQEPAMDEAELRARFEFRISAMNRAMGGEG